jgi:L-fuculose-phosphate aldolase
MTLSNGKQQIADAVRMLEQAGIMDFNGHCSLRLPDGGLLINAGNSVRSALGPDGVVAIDGDGRLIEGTDAPPMEFHIHARIYDSRPDVHAVIHAHPKWTTYFTMAGVPIEPVFPQGALLGELPLLPEIASINSRPMGEALAATLGSGRAALLQSHGTVVVGADMVEAFALCLYLEENAQRQYMARQLGPVRKLTPAEAESSRKHLWKRGLFQKAWDHHHAKLGR